MAVITKSSAASFMGRLVEMAGDGNFERMAADVVRRAERAKKVRRLLGLGWSDEDLAQVADSELDALQPKRSAGGRPRRKRNPDRQKLEQLWGDMRQKEIIHLCGLNSLDTYQRDPWSEKTFGKVAAGLSTKLGRTITADELYLIQTT